MTSVRVVDFDDVELGARWQIDADSDQSACQQQAERALAFPEARKIRTFAVRPVVVAEDRVEPIRFDETPLNIMRRDRPALVRPVTRETYTPVRAEVLEERILQIERAVGRECSQLARWIARRDHVGSASRAHVLRRAIAGDADAVHRHDHTESEAGDRDSSDVLHGHSSHWSLRISFDGGAVEAQGAPLEISQSVAKSRHHRRAWRPRLVDQRHRAGGADSALVSRPSWSLISAGSDNVVWCI